MKKRKAGKEESKKEAKEVIEKEKTTKNLLKQIKVVVVIMIILLASVFIAYWAVQRSKTFEYNGTKFYKEKEGPVMFYKSLLGYVTYSGQSVPFVLKLRNDPRELEDIKVYGEIKNIQENAVFSVAPELENCSNTIITIIDFSRTLKAFGISSIAGTPDKNSSAKDRPYTTCKDAKDKTVILMEASNETSIVKQADCYMMKINNCEIQESFEKFILEFITNSIIEKKA